MVPAYPIPKSSKPGSGLEVRQGQRKETELDETAPENPEGGVRLRKWDRAYL